MKTSKAVTPTTPCPFCKGAGHIPLSAALLRVYRALCSMGGEAGASTIHDRLGGRGLKVEQSAVNNCLERLRNLGLVTRKRAVGNNWTYLAEASAGNGALTDSAMLDFVGACVSSISTIGKGTVEMEYHDDGLKIVRQKSVSDAKALRKCIAVAMGVES